MNFSEPFVRRPVATVLLTAGVVLLGIVAYFQLPIASLPVVERPTISVVTNLPGASADTVASTISAPLEAQLGLISGLKEMVSSSIPSHSYITLEFSLNADIDAAAGAVQAAINAASPLLPKNLPQPPIYLKANPGGFPIIGLALTSDAIPMPEVYDYADTVLAAKLSQIEGVAKIYIGGSSRPAVRVQLNPRALAEMGASPEMVRGALSNTSVDLPKGQISDGLHAMPILVNDQLFKADDYQDVPVTFRNGAVLKLRDVAKIYDGSVNDEREGWFDGKRAVVLYVLKQPDANVVKTVDDIIKSLPQLERWIPPSIKVHVLYDRTLLIRAAIADVQFTIVVATVLVVLVIALFLRRFWATIIPAVTIPVSLAFAPGVIYLLHFSLDNISLMAVTIAVGFVIDDSIIIIENITRRIQAGELPLSAALGGSRQMGFTVISVTFALIAALIPVLFMPDIVGRLFREFGLTLVAAIVASALVSLTLTPMMCGQLLRHDNASPRGRVSVFCEQTLEQIIWCYERSLDWTLRYRWLTLTVAAALAVTSVGLYVNLSKGFLPTQDTGVLRVRTIARANTSFAAMREFQSSSAEVIRADPAVAHVASYIGTGQISNGTMLVGLKPPSERKVSVDEVIARLRKKLVNLDGVKTFLTPVQDLSVGAHRTVARYQYTLTSLNQTELVRWAMTMMREIKRIPQATDVVSNYRTGGLQAGLLVNRTRAGRAGVSIVDIDNTLYDWFGQRDVNTIRFPNNLARVVMEAEPRFRDNPSALKDVFLISGVPVPVMSAPKRTRALVSVFHENRLPGITITFNTPLGVSIGQALTAIKTLETKIGLPNEVHAEFRGEAREAEQASRTQPMLFLAAVIAVYIILGMLYESYAHPFTILSTLPSATFGGLVALAVTGSQFTIITAIAFILLVGIVMKNAIMMVDFALDSRRHAGLSAEQAIRQAATLRFRPIIMTTLAALFGALPLALGTGPGFELRQPLGIAIVGGLLFSQFVTLYTTPAVFLVIDKLGSWRARAA